MTWPAPCACTMGQLLDFVSQRRADRLWSTMSWLLPGRGARGPPPSGTRLVLRKGRHGHLIRQLRCVPLPTLCTGTAAAHAPAKGADLALEACSFGCAVDLRLLQGGVAAPNPVVANRTASVESGAPHATSSALKLAPSSPPTWPKRQT